MKFKNEKGEEIEILAHLNEPEERLSIGDLSEERLFLMGAALARLFKLRKLPKNKWPSPNYPLYYTNVHPMGNFGLAESFILTLKDTINQSEKEMRKEFESWISP
jgi:hypothetical protein